MYEVIKKMTISHDISKMIYLALYHPQPNMKIRSWVKCRNFRFQSLLVMKVSNSRLRILGMECSQTTKVTLLDP